jgi:hypothetical protein
VKDLHGRFINVKAEHYPAGWIMQLQKFARRLLTLLTVMQMMILSH